MKVCVGIFGLLLSAGAMAADNAPQKTSAEAGNFKCTNVALTRRVEVSQDVPGQAVPCSVTYFKDTEGPATNQKLWHSDNDAEFCAKKAQDFVEKLKSWGWNCQNLRGSAP